MSQEIIEFLNLKPHPEGGFYRQTYCSKQKIIINKKERAACSAIYFYLNGDDFSAWHKHDADEMFHHYAGDDLIVYTFSPTNKLQTQRLGVLNVETQTLSQIFIPANTWMALEVIDAKGYALIGATVTPGFLFEHFELGKANQLCQQFPQYEDVIRRLSRE